MDIHRFFTDFVTDFSDFLGRSLVIITGVPEYTSTIVLEYWVQYLRPPGPFSFPDSRDLLEVLGDFLGRERAHREDPLGSGRIP